MLKKILLGLLGLVVLTAVGVQFTPSHWKVTRSIVVHAPSKTIFPLVADWKKWDLWSGFKTPGMVCAYSGAPSGVGAICDIKDKNMRVTTEIMKADPATGIMYECRMPGWDACDCTIAFSPEGGSTRVDFSYEGNHGRNPLHRLMGLFVDKMLGQPLAQGLMNLKGLAELNAAKKK